MSTTRHRPTHVEDLPAEALEPEDDFDQEPEADAYEEEAPPAAASMMPLVVSVVAGLLVLGLMGAILLSPKNPAPAAGNGTTATGQSTLPAGPAGGTNGAAPKIGEMAPDWTLNDLDGKQVTLSSFRGVKPVWVNFWATWCPPCRGEMPIMEVIYKQHKDQIEILGVDVQEFAGQVKPFITDGGYTWPFLLDDKALVSRQYRVAGIPTHVFIGKDGVVKDIVVSGLDRARMDTEIQELMR